MNNVNQYYVPGNVYKNIIDKGWISYIVNVIANIEVSGTSKRESVHNYFSYKSNGANYQGRDSNATNLLGAKLESKTLNYKLFKESLVIPENEFLASRESGTVNSLLRGYDETSISELLRKMDCLGIKGEYINPNTGDKDIDSNGLLIANQGVYSAEDVTWDASTNSIQKVEAFTELFDIILSQEPSIDLILISNKIIKHLNTIEVSTQSNQSVIESIKLIAGANGKPIFAPSSLLDTEDGGYFIILYNQSPRYKFFLGTPPRIKSGGLKYDDKNEEYYKQYNMNYGGFVFFGDDVMVRRKIILA